MIFASIVSGEAIGVSDQYLCLLLLSLAARCNLIPLQSEVKFIASVWFIIIISIVWIATILPAYGALIDPVFLRVVNTTVGLFSGVLVPASGALLALATASFMTGSPASPAAANYSLQWISNSTSNSDLWLIGGGGAIIASLLTFMKFLIKPMIVTASGMTGTTASAAIFKTIENVMALVLMAAIYFLGRLNSWLLVLLMAVVTLILISILVFALYQLWKMSLGIGKVLRLLEVNPKAGIAVIMEPFIWGSGWILIKGWQSGVGKLALCGVSLVIIWVILPIVFFFIPPVAAAIPFVASFAAIYFFGVKSSKKLFQTIEEESKAADYKPSSIKQPEY